jgi:hypothetical protein
VTFERREFETTARDHAAHILGSEPLVFAPKRMSARAHWYEDVGRQRLVVVANPEEEATKGDLILAYALAWQQDRDLHLVLPGHLVAHAQARIAWVETEVRLWRYHGHLLEGPLPGLARSDVLDQLHTLHPRTLVPYKLAPEHEGWLKGIDCTDLDPQNRSCRSWHHHGLQVLRVTRARGGLRVQAGVQYHDPPPDREPYDRVFTVPPKPKDLDAINAAIQVAKDDGRSLTVATREHRMQAQLARQHQDLGLEKVWRGYPAYRGANPELTGYIDFLGLDASGHLHVVETKIGHDPAVGLQALDYALWARASEEEIRADLNLPPSKQDRPIPLAIDLVLGPSDKQSAMSPYLAGQLEALAGDVKIAIWLASDAGATPLGLRRVPPEELWDSDDPAISDPIVGPRWAERVVAGMLRPG